MISRCGLSLRVQRTLPKLTNLAAILRFISASAENTPHFLTEFLRVRFISASAENTNAQQFLLVHLTVYLCECREHVFIEPWLKFIHGLSLRVQRTLSRHIYAFIDLRFISASAENTQIRQLRVPLLTVYLCECREHIACAPLML